MKATVFPENFTSLVELIDYFNSEEKCLQYYEFIRWHDIISCPHCNCIKIYKFKDNKRYKCSGCKKQFTVRVGTIYEDSKISLRKWFIATYLLSANKKGISSYALARQIKVTQKTAWFMLHRIRHKLSAENELDNQLEGVIQLDETFVGGKNKNRHKDKKVEHCEGRSFKDKTPVMGLLQQQVYEIIERPHKVITDRVVKEKIVNKQSVVVLQTVKNTQAIVLQPIIWKTVHKDCILISDEWHGYRGLDYYYDHRIIDHRAKQYVDAAGNTTNAIEGLWTSFKRAYIGVYHFMSKEHLQAYANEIAYRYNTRAIPDAIRFINSLGVKHTPLKYKQLIKTK